jgi:catechol 2,3-dioxygenase-like lactoylglutathione lyase family enzyme
VALRVDGLDDLLGELSADGVPLRDHEPRQGAHGSRIAFLDGAGALVELVEGGD